MSEWLKEHAWKACVGETLPSVRIPLSPPDFRLVFTQYLRALCSWGAGTPRATARRLLVERTGRPRWDVARASDRLGLPQQIELLHVLDDERAVHRTHALQAFRVVVDDEQSRARRLQPVEPQVRRPAMRPIVVLNQALREDRRREFVRHAHVAQI